MTNKFILTTKFVLEKAHSYTELSQLLHEHLYSKWPGFLRSLLQTPDPTNHAFPSLPEDENTTPPLFSPKSSLESMSFEDLQKLEASLAASAKDLENVHKVVQESQLLIEADILELTRLEESNAMLFEDERMKHCQSVERAEIRCSILREEVQQTEDLVNRLKEELLLNKESLNSVEERLNKEVKENSEKTAKATLALQIVSQTNESLKELQKYKLKLIQRLNSLEIKRRSAHNQLQELKGNLRVFCRVRPSLTDKEPLLNFAFSQDQTCISVISPGTPASQTTTFEFDHVFKMETTQFQVFAEVQNLIQSALDGFNVSLFAYGQTGSGKTYTMFGTPDSPKSSPALSNAGVIPRAVSLIFQNVKELMSLKGWYYKLHFSALEIYNENVRDLLHKANIGDSTSRGGGSFCDVRLDSKGNSVVSNLTHLPVASSEEVFSALSTAERNRSVAETGCHEHSSRSHSVVQIHISGTHPSKCVSSTLSLIDLAGSERLEKSQVTGDRLRETQHINKSLSALCNVIYALGKNTESLWLAAPAPPQ